MQNSYAIIFYRSAHKQNIKTNFSENRNKPFIFVISVVLTAFIILLFFIDDSLEWNVYKIISFVIVSVWCFFIIPSFRFIYLKYKDIQGSRV